MRWGKPTKNSRKHRDPRYFLNEAVVEPGLTKAGQWPDEEIRGMERPEVDQESDVLEADQRLSSSDLGVLQWILKDLQTGTGRGNMAERFLDVMDKLGVDLDSSRGETPLESALSRYGAEAPDVDADEMEDALGRFQDRAGRDAWANKRKGPREV